MGVSDRRGGKPGGGHGSVEIFYVLQSERFELLPTQCWEEVVPYPREIVMVGTVSDVVPNIVFYPPREVLSYGDRPSVEGDPILLLGDLLLTLP